VELVQQFGRDHVPVNPYLHGTVERTELSVPTWESRPSVASAIEELLSQKWYKGQLIHRQFTKGRAGRAGKLSPWYKYTAQCFFLAQVTPPLPEAVVEALKSRNIHELYTHQVAAIQSINQSKNVVVSTSTASGKSIIYQARFNIHEHDMHEYRWFCSGTAAFFSAVGSYIKGHFCVPDQGPCYMFYLKITHQAGLGPCAGSTNFVTPVTKSLSGTGESLGLFFTALGSRHLMNWTRFLRTTVTHHKRPEQVDIHL